MDDDTSDQPPKAWLDALERADADVAAGRTHDLEQFLRTIEAEDAAELSARAAGKVRFEKPSPAG